MKGLKCNLKKAAKNTLNFFGEYYFGKQTIDFYKYSSAFYKEYLQDKFFDKYRESAIKSLYWNIISSKAVPFFIEGAGICLSYFYNSEAPFVSLAISANGLRIMSFKSYYRDMQKDFKRDLAAIDSDETLEDYAREISEEESGDFWKK